MKKRHQLRLVGITYNQIESGVYAVILEEVDGQRRIPIIIGYPEAQAIECKLQQINTPRPLTHDLMKSIMETFNLRLACIDIHKMPNGVFAADLVMEGPQGELHKIDARSSDALALAVRTDSPIYTTAEVLDEAGFKPKKLDEEQSEPEEEVARPVSPEDFLRQAISTVKSDIDSFSTIEDFILTTSLDPEDADAEIMDFLKNYSDKEIESQISRFAAEEKYEVAARLKALLKRRKEAE
ncbi:MAG: bifunctional nuclease family protein [Muribaculaceae bacterium]|nr:bifunctional nuclease family protein [Muribaculaceae bacterium]MDE5956904.1 bifunctional nuclease family protein [Muribaculaceae bacterium]